MRQLVSAEMPSAAGTLVVRGKDFRHLRQVLRIQAGQTLDVRLPSGELRPMRVAQVSPASIVLEAGEGKPGTRRTETGVTAAEVEQESLSAAPLWLLQFLPKIQSMDLIVRQAAEAGVSAIVPVVASRSRPGDGANRTDRWNRIIREARQQSGSPVRTAITAPCRLDEAVDLWLRNAGENPCAVVLSEKPDGCAPLHSVTARQEFSAAALAVGCEGGISPEELALLKSAGFAPVHFKTNILRAETAALYGLAAVQILLTEHETWQSKESSC